MDKKTLGAMPYQSMRVDVELPAIRQAMQQSLVNYIPELERNIQLALESNITPEKIEQITMQKASDIVTKTIENSVEHCFGWRGHGKPTLESIVKDRIEEAFPEIKMGTTECANFILGPEDVLIKGGVNITHYSKIEYPEEGQLAHKRNKIVFCCEGEWNEKKS